MILLLLLLLLLLLGSTDADWYDADKVLPETATNYSAEPNLQQHVPKAMAMDVANKGQLEMATDEGEDNDDDSHEEMDEGEDNDDGSSSSSSSSSFPGDMKCDKSSSSVDKQFCRTCTFLNATTNITCEICEELLCDPSSEEQSLPLLSRSVRTRNPVNRYGFVPPERPDAPERPMSLAENQSTTGFQNLGNTCYMNSTLRLLNIIREDVEKVLNKEQGPLHDEIRHIWKHCADEKNKKTAYCMKNFFREFVKCDKSMIKSSNERKEEEEEEEDEWLEVDWEEMQEPFLFLKHMLKIVLNKEEMQKSYFWAYTTTYSECNFCKKTQSESRRGENVPFYELEVQGKQSIPQAIIEGALKIEDPEPQKCDLCYESEIDKRAKEAELKKREYKDVEWQFPNSRTCTHSSQWSITDDQDFIIVEIKRNLLYASGKLKEQCYKFPSDKDISIPGNGKWKLVAVLLYVSFGNRAGEGSRGHYYVITEEGAYDDDNIEYDKERLICLKKIGYENHSFGKARAHMFVLKRTEYSSPADMSSLIRTTAHSDLDVDGVGTKRGRSLR